MKTREYKGSIQSKLTRIILSIVSLVFLIVYLFFIVLQFRQEEENSIAQAKLVEHVISQDLAKLILLNDVSVASDITQKLKYFPILQFAVVYTKNGTPVYRYVNDKTISFPSKRTCKASSFEKHQRYILANLPITYANSKLGCVYIKVLHTTFWEIFDKYFLMLLLFYVMVMLLSLLLVRWYAAKFITPIMKLTKFLETIELTSSLDERIEVADDDEFGKLYEETNIMLEGLKRSLMEKISAKKEIDYLKHYDSLTGLAKKELFLKKLEQKIQQKSSENYHVLLSIDIDQFNMLNDAYGHRVGDLVLQQFSIELQKIFKEADIIAKIGIDTFLLSYRDLAESEEKSLEIAEKLLNSITKMLHMPVTVENKKIMLRVHVGVTVYTDGGQDAQTVLKQVDNALQNAKQNEKYYAFYNKEMEDKVKKNLRLYTDLIVALKEKQFVLYYQTQYSIDGEVIGAEALVRWRHPEKGLISPGEFIPAAESSGQIIELGNWILEEVCRQLALWQENIRTRHWTLSVNVSAKQFNNEHYISFLKALIARYKFNPENLKIELTESLLSNNFDEVVEKMHIIREMGMKISIDDFGTGYSSLEYLKKLPLDQLKIDQSFVFDMLENKMDFAIVQMIIGIAEAFDFDAIAEGVETEAHLEALKKLGCHAIQGYYFSKPQPIDQILPNPA